MKIKIAIIIFIFSGFLGSLYSQNDSLNKDFKISELKDGYLSRVTIWSPYKLYVFYVYSKDRPSKIDFRITSCKDLLLIDETLKFVYIDETYPNEIREIQKMSLDEWKKKIPVFSRYKKRKYSIKGLTYSFSSLKCNLKVLRFDGKYNSLFEHYWGNSILPYNVNSGIETYIAFDVR